MRRLVPFFVLFLAACAASGKVSTQLKDSGQTVVPPPERFQSPIEELDEISRKADFVWRKLPRVPNFKSRLWREYVGWQQAVETLRADQESSESALRDHGELKLEPGQSYTFELESFCVHTGEKTPIDGDGFRIGPLKGKAQKWLPKILNEYAKHGFSQNDTQHLIWALLTEARFDDLSAKQRAFLLKVYPDAPARFGVRAVEDKVKELFHRFTPKEIERGVESLDRYRSVALDYQKSYQEIAAVMAPPSTRKTPIAVGWQEMPGGYLARIDSIDSYTAVRVDLYVPPDVKGKPTFRPSDLVALPAQGQRISVGPKPTDRPGSRWPVHTKEDCDDLSKWKPASCKEMIAEDRKEILRRADPKNFSKTRYKLGPSLDKSIEEETDCSVFTYEIFRRSGFEYPMSVSNAIECVSTFDPVPEGQGKPGDLIIFPGHVGILDENGKVISATRGGRQELSTIDPKDPTFKSAITRYDPSLFKGTGKILRWSCP